MSIAFCAWLFRFRIEVIESESENDSSISLVLVLVSIELRKKPVDGFSAGLVDDDNLLEWEIMIMG